MCGGVDGGKWGCDSLQMEIKSTASHGATMLLKQIFVTEVVRRIRFSYTVAQAELIARLGSGGLPV